jgi:hypothetical protein
VDVLIGNEISGELVFSIPANLYTQLDELNRRTTSQWNMCGGKFSMILKMDPR